MYGVNFWVVNIRQSHYYSPWRNGNDCEKESELFATKGRKDQGKAGFVKLVGLAAIKSL